MARNSARHCALLFSCSDHPACLPAIQFASHCRERSASMYAVLPYAIATGVVEIPYLLAQTLLFAPVVYFMEGFRIEAEPFFLFVIVFMEVHCAFLQPYVLS
jgi:ABC-2 type transporter